MTGTRDSATRVAPQASSAPKSTAMKNAQRRRSFVAFTVIAIAIMMWQCNYSGSCRTNTDCTGTEHVCVFGVSDGCGGDGHCASTSDSCGGGVFQIRGCGCNGSPAYPACVSGGGYDIPVVSQLPCSEVTRSPDAGADAPSFIEDSATPD